MAFGPNIYPGSVPSLPLAGNFPGFTLYGDEPNGLTFDMREIQGVFWIASNAVFNQGTLAWQQVDSAMPSFAFTFDGTAGVISIYKAAAGSPSPIVWGSPGASLSYS
jgi:hypothetical protein